MTYQKPELLKLNAYTLDINSILAGSLGAGKIFI